MDMIQQLSGNDFQPAYTGNVGYWMVVLEIIYRKGGFFSRTVTTTDLKEPGTQRLSNGRLISLVKNKKSNY